MANKMKTYEVLKTVGIEGKFYNKGEQFTAALPKVVEDEGLYRQLYKVVEIVEPETKEEPTPKAKKK
jgi:hypothetical protein